MPSTTRSDDPLSPVRGLRVLLIGVNYAPETSGIAPYSAAMASGLQARGYDVRVLTTKPHYPEWRVPPEYAGGVIREEIDGVPVTRLPHYVPSRPSGVRRLLSELSFGWRALTAAWHRPDVVVFVSPALFATAIAMVRVRMSRRMRSIVWIQDLYGLGIVEAAGHQSGGAIERVISGTERMVVGSADAVTVIHDRFADSVASLGAQPDRVAVIRNWSHVDGAEVADREATRRLLGWQRDEVVALHTGNMGLKQDLGNLVEAARLAQVGRRSVRFVVMGNGSQRQVLQSRASSERLTRIQFVDAVPEEQYLSALQAADVLLVNESEGLRDMAVPSKLTSYFTAGRPVVAATDPHSITAAEVRAAGAGVQVQPAAPARLLAAVESVAADVLASAEYGAHGREYRDRVLSEEAALNAFESLLDRVSPHRGRPSSGLDRRRAHRSGRRQRRWAITSS